jgi:predicted amidohydrolase
MKLKFLLVQNSAILGNLDATLSNASEILGRYKDCKPDLIVFPEVWSVGWDCSNFRSVAEDLSDSKTIDFLKSVAVDFKSIVVGGSFIQKINNNGVLSYKNTCPVINSNGVLVDTYNKTHLFSHKSSEEDKYIDSGNQLLLLNLGYTKIGLSICYDIRFPEIHRQYSRNGAEILINVAAWSSKKLEHWNIMHKSRAIENQCFLCAVNQTGKIAANVYNLGHSMVINPWGDVIDSLDSQEDCLYTEIDLDELRKIRSEFPLLTDRKDCGVEIFNCKEIKLYE